MVTAVTGASGHVGGCLIRKLLAEGRSVRVLVHSDRRALEGLDIEEVRGELHDPGVLDRLMRDAGTVFHCAARISIVGGQHGSVSDTNVAGTEAVVDACIRNSVRRLVHFSSIHAFSAHPRSEPVDESRLPALTKDAPAYDKSKAMGERVVREGIARGLDAVIVNPTSIIGPPDFKPSRMGSVLLDLYRGTFPALMHGGYDWVDVRDVADGALAAERRGRSGHNYLLSGYWMPLPELAGLVHAHGGARPPRLTVPLSAAAAVAPFAYLGALLTGKEPRLTPETISIMRNHRYIVRTKAEKELGYTSRPTGETVRDFIDWSRKQGMIPSR